MKRSLAVRFPLESRIASTREDVDEAGRLLTVSGLQSLEPGSMECAKPFVLSKRRRRSVSQSPSHCHNQAGASFKGVLDHGVLIELGPGRRLTYIGSSLCSNLGCVKVPLTLGKPDEPHPPMSYSSSLLNRRSYEDQQASYTLVDNNH